MKNYEIEEDIWKICDISQIRQLRDQLFITVTDENHRDQIPLICLSALWDAAEETEDFSDMDKSVNDEVDDKAYIDIDLCIFKKNIQRIIESKNYKDLVALLYKLERPYTIINESYYIDKSFRDTYYMYFSNQHFDTKRYSRRLSFFQGEMDYEVFFSTSNADDPKEIATGVAGHVYIGSCVINPLITGAIGRTLINPNYVLSKEQKPIYIRLSKFIVHVLGKKLCVYAFPYRMQDQETMRCAEVTILNLLDYYSNSYVDYRSIIPEEIIISEQKHSFERMLPARGVTSTIMSSVLSDFGFSTRLYNLSALNSGAYSLTALNNREELKRWLYYYVESGIPVALNLKPANDNGSGHSIVCIGHGQIREQLVHNAKRRKWIPWDNKECHPIINSADFYNDFVVIDDNEPLYQNRPYEKLSLYEDMRLDSIIVPMYKRMFMEAPDALVVIQNLLHEKEYSIDAWAGDFLDKGEDVIIRLFMASSYSFKSFRSETLSSVFARSCYSAIPMPRFVWICELYRLNDYERHKAFGEVVIDATSTRNRGQRSLILMHYPGVMVVRYPDQTGNEFGEEIVLNDELTGNNNDTGLFDAFSRNLASFI